MLIVDCRDFGRLLAVDVDAVVADRDLGGFDAMSPSLLVLYSRGPKHSNDFEEASSLWRACVVPSPRLQETDARSCNR